MPSIHCVGAPWKLPDANAEDFPEALGNIVRALAAARDEWHNAGLQIQGKQQAPGDQGNECQNACTFQSKDGFAEANGRTRFGVDCMNSYEPEDEAEMRRTSKACESGVLSELPICTTHSSSSGEFLLEQAKTSLAEEGVHYVENTCELQSGLPLIEEASDAMQQGESMAPAIEKKVSIFTETSCPVRSVEFDEALGLGMLPRAGSEEMKDSMSMRKRLLVQEESRKELNLHELWRIEESTHDDTLVSRYGNFARRGSDLAMDTKISEKEMAFQFASLHEEEEEREVKRSSTCIGRCITHPSGIKRVIWDALAICLIAYDTIMIPMQAFDLPADTATMVMGKIGLAYWSADIVFSFLTGFFKRGLLEMRPKRVAIHYMTTWLPFDALVVGLDWAVEFLDRAELGSSSNAKVTKAGRTVKTSTRLIRSLRLLRLIKVGRKVDELQDNINSEYANICINVFKFIIIIVLVNHIIACLWYTIGISTDAGWVTRGNVPNLHKKSIAYRYTTSLHWSLTQFTPASMEIFPVTVEERTFAVMTLLFALIVFSSFVSSITTAMDSLRKLKGTLDKTSQFTRLRWYFRDHKIPQKLAIRIFRHLKHKVSLAKYCTQAKDVELLSTLSKPLKLELQNAIISPTLRGHPFFNELFYTNAQAMSQICTICASQFSVSDGDVLGSLGESAKYMYFVARGRLMYKDNLDIAHDLENMRITVHLGQWICEMTVWLDGWRYRGEISAAAFSDVTALDGDSFRDICKGHGMVMVICKRYARDYSAALHRREGPVSDLHYAEFHDVYNDAPGGLVSSHGRKARLSTHTKKMNKSYFRNILPKRISVVAKENNWLAKTRSSAQGKAVAFHRTAH